MADITDTLPGEIWKPIPGLEGYYSASSLGRIYRHDRWISAKLGSKKFYPGDICGGHMGQRGYRKVSVFGKNLEIHRLICLAFHGLPPSEKHHAAHWDDDKANNVASNLRWATPKENAEDRLRNGLQARGEQISTGRLDEERVLAIRAEYNGNYGHGAVLAKKYNVGHNAIMAIVRRNSWTHI